MSLISRLHLLPIIIFVWFPVTFVITYVTAVNLGDVFPIFPYISDTGTFSPESCIFGQMLNTGSVLMAVAVYIRYREIQEIYRTTAANNEKVENLNKRSVWLGFVSSFGVSIVGNFQETNVFTVHVFGAFLAFGLGTVYICMQTVISFSLQQNASKTNIIRATLCAICVVGFAICSLTGGISLLLFKGEDVTKWGKPDGGYDFHLASTVTEWFIAISLMGFILTYTENFKKISFEEPVVHIDSRQSSKKIFPQNSVQAENGRF